MFSSGFNVLRVLPVAALLATLVAASNVHAQSTTLWFGSTGDWSVPGNWSNGEPTAASTAVVQFAGTVNVTMPGEVCRSLWLGMASGIVNLTTTGGSLNVVDSLRVGAVGSGFVQHQAGTITAGMVSLGSPGQSGSYLQFAGNLTTPRFECGTRGNNSSGTYSASVLSPVCNITDSLYVGRFGSFVFGAGTLTVGNAPGDGVLVDGAFQVTNAPTMNVRGFKMTDQATFSRTLVFGTNSTLVSSGPVELNGQLLVIDLSSPDGTYELIRGNPLTGTFDLVTMPTTGNWSWRIEGNSLWVTRGEVAVEPVTWSRVKGLLSE